jgi:hypothetical protein
MSDRINRLRSLAFELEQLGLELAERSSASAAVLFIDRVHRCACFTPSERSDAGVVELLDDVDQAWAESKLELGTLAGLGLDLENLMDRVYALQAGDDEETVQDWAVELLLLAGVAPWVPGKRGEQMLEVMWSCLDLVQAYPERFHPAAIEVLDRIEHEGDAGLHRTTREVFEALRELPLLALMDRAVTSRTPEQVQERVDGFVESLGAQETTDEQVSLVIERRLALPRAPAHPSWFRGIFGAEEAWTDAVGHARAQAEIISRAGEREGIRAAAATDQEVDVPLGLRSGHQFWLVARGNELHLSVRGHAWREIVASISGQEDPIVAIPDDDGGRWRLPATSAWPVDGLAIRMRLGADGWSFVLERPRASS